MHKAKAAALALLTVLTLTVSLMPLDVFAT